MLKLKTLFILITYSLIGQAQTPNILLVIADDLGTDALNGYTDQTLKPITPTLDSIRNEGITFTNAWAAPVCTPTRASIMSGKHGSKTDVLGVPGNLGLEHTSLLSTLNAQSPKNYTNAVVGKWHISQPQDPLHPSQHGAEYYMGFLAGFPADYNEWEKTQDGTRETVNNYVTSTITNSAITWVDRQDSPWLLWVAHAAPHTPFHVPPSEMYSIRNPTTNLQKFIAMIESVDYEIARLLASMSEAERENTVVIFMGDNGTSGTVIRDYPREHSKGTLYEGGIRVPFIISGKVVTRKNEVEPALINVLDLHATILELTGESLNGGVHNSLSFKHLLDGSIGTNRDYNYMELEESRTFKYTIRDSQYKLIELGNDSLEMYDLSIDPFETNALDLNNLTTAQQEAKIDLESEASTRRISWSCRDHIQNGDETGIDCGGTSCIPCTNSVINSEETNIKLFPNPSTGILTIVSETPVTLVRIYNSLGQEVYKQSSIGRTAELDIASLKADLYHVEVQTNSTSSYQAILKL